MITKQYLYYFEEDNFMKIRNEISQGITDASLLEFDVIWFLDHNGNWGPDGYPLTNFESINLSNGCYSNSFSIGLDINLKYPFDYKLYYEVLYAATRTFVRRKLAYWLFDKTASIHVSSPDIKFKDIGGYKRICISFITKVY